MINKIKEHEVLSKYVEKDCCENDICVSFDEGITPDDYAIIKVDKYYNSLKSAEKTPPSIDCLIVRKCEKKGYGLTLVELKAIETGKGFTLDNMKGKFQTTLYDFIKVRFEEVLDIDYHDMKIYFVTKQDIYKRDIGLKMELLMNIRFEFNGKTLMVQPKMPTPTIKKCYGK